MRLFRVVSVAEKEDILLHATFRITLNTIEGKQFFTTLHAVEEFATISRSIGFHPPYQYKLELEVDEDCLAKIPHDYQILDGHEAFTILGTRLNEFSKCINFDSIIYHAIQDHI